MMILDPDCCQRQCPLLCKLENRGAIGRFLYDSFGYLLTIRPAMSSDTVIQLFIADALLVASNARTGMQLNRFDCAREIL